jgi:ribosomal protein S18 acetylase RimI-like enzyme
MPTDEIELVSFLPEHIDGALALSRQAGWPHRAEDWQLALTLSRGLVALDDRRQVVGSILMTPYGSDCATINMVIVDAAMRGRGLGRKLMNQAIALAGERPLRLAALPQARLHRPGRDRPASGTGCSTRSCRECRAGEGRGPAGDKAP